MTLGGEVSLVGDEWMEIEGMGWDGGCVLRVEGGLVL